MKLVGLVDNGDDMKGKMWKKFCDIGE